MQRRDLLGTAVLIPVALASTEASQSQAQAPRDSLGTTLQPYLARYHLPALAAAVVLNGQIVAAGAVGTRRAGTDRPVTLQDRFHICSNTKAITSLTAAIFVEQGKLRWNGTVGEVFPELAGTMDAGLREVTLEQLLSHTSGIPSDNSTFINLLLQSFGQDGNLDELRYWVVKQWSTQPLRSKPGTQFAYANMGYTMVGAILERIGQATWEELVVSHVFNPFGFKTAGFGPQASLGRVDAPLGHRVGSDGVVKAMLAGPNGDGPEIIGPAGTIHSRSWNLPPGPGGTPARDGAAPPWYDRRPCASCIQRSLTSRRGRAPLLARPRRPATDLDGASGRCPFRGSRS